MERINHIYENRVAQLDSKGYASEMRRLRVAGRAADKRVASERTQASVRPMTTKEQSAFDSQGHYTFRDMSVTEQVKLNNELASMWGQIPAHLQEKARGLVS